MHRNNPQGVNTGNTFMGAAHIDRYLGSSFDIVYAVYKQLGNMPVFLEFVNETSPRMGDQYADIIGRYDHIEVLEASALNSKEVAEQAAADAMEYRDTSQQLIDEAEEFKQFVNNVVENTIQDIEDRFAEFIVASGYEFIGNYGIGIEVTEYNQLLRDVNGEFWRLSGQQSIPYITTGAGLPEDGAFIPVGDASLRQDLDDPTHGSKIVRYDDNNTVYDAIKRNREDFWANKEIMGGIYTHYVREDDGTPVAGAECAVYVGKSGVLATGLKDKFGKPLANPFVSAANGLVQFVADPGIYTLQVSFDLVVHTYSVYFADEQLRTDLVDPSKGANLIGYGESNVHTALEELEQFNADLANPDMGAPMVARVAVAVDSIADLLALPDGQRKNDLRYLVKGYYAGSVLGGGEFFYDPTRVGENDLGTVIDGFVRVLSGGVSPMGFGAIGDGFADDTIPLQMAIDHAIATGSSQIAIEGRTYNIVGSLSNRSNVTFVGEGSLTGLGTYRCRVVPEDAPPPPHFSNINPTTHLKRFLATGFPVVVLVGDSISTRQPDSLDESSTLYASLISKLKNDNPRKNINFLNRAIGGLTWEQANGVATTNWPEWYTDHSAPWLSYVEPLQPDLVIFAFGMNDGHLDSFDANNVTSVISKLNSWDKVPDIVFVTTPVPTLEPDDAFELFGDKWEQENRDRNAGWIRSYADATGYGYLDVNRMCNMARDARDILNTTSVRTQVSGPLPSGSFLADDAQECRDFAMRVVLSEDTFSTGNTLAVKLGPQRNDVVHIRASGGYIHLDFYYHTKGTAVVYRELTTGIPVPPADFAMQVEKRGNLFTASFNHAPYDGVVHEKIISHGGVFRPRIGWANTNLTTGPLHSIAFFNMGQDGRVAPTITNDELWGVSSPNPVMKYPYGGNGINHPTSLGFAAVYQPVISASSFGVEGAYVDLGGTSNFEISANGVIRQWGFFDLVEPVHNGLIVWPFEFPHYCTNVQLSIGIMIEDMSTSPEASEAQSLINPAAATSSSVRYSAFFLTTPELGRRVYWEATGN